MSDLQSSVPAVATPDDDQSSVSADGSGVGIASYSGSQSSPSDSTDDRPQAGGDNERKERYQRPFAQQSSHRGRAAPWSSEQRQTAQSTSQYQMQMREVHQEQQQQQLKQPPFFALDVECVATGRKHNERAVAQVLNSG